MKTSECQCTTVNKPLFLVQFANLCLCSLVQELFVIQMFLQRKIFVLQGLYLFVIFVLSQYQSINLARLGLVESLQVKVLAVNFDVLFSGHL